MGRASPNIANVNKAADVAILPGIEKGVGGLKGGAGDGGWGGDGGRAFMMEI